MTATLTVLRFEIVRTSRSRRYLIFAFGFPALFHLVFSRAGGSAAARYRPIGLPWPSHFMVSMMAYGVLSGSMNAGGIRLAADRASGWTRHLRNIPLSAVSYVVGKMTLGVLLTLPVMAVVSLLAIVDGHVTLSFLSWLAVMGALLLGSLPFAVLGVLLGYLMTADTGAPITGGILFVLADFGGLFQPVASMPAGLRTLAELTPTFHLAGLGWWALGGRTDVGPHLLALALDLVGFALLAVWRMRVDEARAGA